MARGVYKGELADLIADGAMLVDVRESFEHDLDNSLPGHTHVPLSKLKDLRAKLTSARPVIFYCRSGLLSFQAAEIAGSWTSQPVYYLAGGLVNYIAEDNV
mgnify:CR=1 FL=1